jgi:hypothetical protein
MQNPITPIMMTAATIITMIHHLNELPDLDTLFATLLLNDADEKSFTALKVIS